MFGTPVILVQFQAASRRTVRLPRGGNSLLHGHALSRSLDGGPLAPTLFGGQSTLPLVFLHGARRPWRLGRCRASRWVGGGVSVLCCSHLWPNTQTATPIICSDIPPARAAQGMAKTPTLSLRGDGQWTSTPILLQNFPEHSSSSFRALAAKFCQKIDNSGPRLTNIDQLWPTLVNTWQNYVADP